MFPKSHSKENISQQQDQQLLLLGGDSTSTSKYNPCKYDFGKGRGSEKAAGSRVSYSDSGSVFRSTGTMPTHFAHVNQNLLSAHQQQAPEEVNLHQKLRRQLSLNPTGCDPRLYRIQQHQQKIPNAVGAHRTLQPTLSGGPPRTHLSNQWDLHPVNICFIVFLFL